MLGENCDCWPQTRSRRKNFPNAQNLPARKACVLARFFFIWCICVCVNVCVPICICLFVYIHMCMYVRPRGYWYQCLVLVGSCASVSVFDCYCFYCFSFIPVSVLFSKVSYPFCSVKKNKGKWYLRLRPRYASMARDICRSNRPPAGREMTVDSSTISVNMASLGGLILAFHSQRTTQSNQSDHRFLLHLERKHSPGPDTTRGTQLVCATAVWHKILWILNQDY